MSIYPGGTRDVLLDVTDSSSRTFSEWLFLRPLAQEDPIFWLPFLNLSLYNTEVVFVYSIIRGVG